MTPVDLIISTVQAGDTLLQSAVCCGTAMAEVMTDFALLEAAEDGEILEDITDDVTEGSNVEDIMFEVPLSDGTDSECCSRVFFFPPENLIITSHCREGGCDMA